MAELRRQEPERGSQVERRAATGEIGGQINLSEEVVAKIAGFASRDVPGVYSLGRSRLISFGDASRRGVEAEVGQTQAALDVDVVLEHGADVHEMAAELRRRVAAEVHRMAGRDVVEVNINIVDIHVPEVEEAPPEQPRVR